VEVQHQPWNYGGSGPATAGKILDESQIQQEQQYGSNMEVILQKIEHNC